MNSITKTPLFNFWQSGKFNISLFLLILILAALEPKAGDFLRFDRHAIEAGQWWRLISGHLVHLGWAHSFLNLTGLGLITVIFQRELSGRNDSGALLFCILCTSFGIYCFSPSMIWYVGLSGSLHGYLIYYLIKGYKVSPIISVGALSVITGKVIWEQTPWANTSSTEQLIGGAVAIDSHFYGSVAGIIIGLASLAYSTSHQKNEVT
ncbi:MAG: rhombosortase [Pseudomonadales bacterium]|nr:rhombosortase [Pseudomonadales bacterium]